jgi:hypothetical protein
MKEILKRYEQVNNEMKVLTEEKEQIKAEIRLYMINNKYQKHKIDNYNISYSLQSRNSLDKIKLKEFVSDEDLKKCYKKSEYTVVKVLTDDQLEKMKHFMK